MATQTIHFDHEEPRLKIEVHIPAEWEALSNDKRNEEIIARIESGVALIRRIELAHKK